MKSVVNLWSCTSHVTPLHSPLVNRLLPFAMETLSCSCCTTGQYNLLTSFKSTKLCVLLESTKMITTLVPTVATILLVLCPCNPVRAFNDIVGDLILSSPFSLASNLSENS
ncbi:hypothetical protein V6Z12_D12G019400 [Gossypium hirsutum]